jgi:hypothetical protein
MCAAMTRSMAPTSLPPMNTTGTTGGAAAPGAAAAPRRQARARSSSRPRGSRSSSCTAGCTPMPQNSRFTAWHMQQVLTLKTTTALSDASRSTRSAAVSAAAAGATTAGMYHACSAAAPYCIVDNLSRASAYTRLLIRGLAASSNVVKVCESKGECGFALGLAG